MLILIFVIICTYQRHFATFAVVFPSTESLFTIYNAILSDHMENPANKFQFLVRKMCSNVVNATLLLHAKSSQQFSPTAVKFHYIFNLRDLSNVFQASRHLTHHFHQPVIEIGNSVFQP